MSLWLNYYNLYYELKIRPFSSLGYLFLGELYADMGQREEALENLKKAREMFKEMRID